MTLRKVASIWSSGPGEAMGSTAGRILQLLIVALAIGGLGALAWFKRWWELVALVTPILIITAVGAASLASNRRGEMLRRGVSARRCGAFAGGDGPIV